MGKGNRFNQKPKKKNNGYFVKNEQQNGTDFILRKNARDIKNDSKYIFKDLAHSDVEIDVPNMVNYFTNLTFTTNLYQAAYEQLSVYNAEVIGLNTYMQIAQASNIYIDPNTHINEYTFLTQQKLAAYQIITLHLSNILSLFNTSADEDFLKLNIETQLKSLSTQLTKYRRII